METDNGQALQHTQPPYVVDSDSASETDESVSVIEVHTEPELLATRDIEVFNHDVCTCRYFFVHD